MIVRFYYLHEFLAELERSAPARGLLRLTHSQRATSLPPCREWRVVAGYLNKEGDLVELTLLVGATLGPDHPSHGEVADRARKIAAQIEEACRDRGIEVRAGTYVSGQCRQREDDPGPAP